MSTQNLVKQVTAKEIHDELYLASDNLLEEAKQILEEDFEYNKLKELGFKSIKRVIDRDDAFTKRRYAETAAYYRQKYPLHKFLLPLSIELICKKYGLFLGDAENFIGEIPRKNLDEILSFKINDEDRPESDNSVIFRTTWMDDKFASYFLCEGKWCQTLKEESSRQKINLKVCASKTMFNTRGLDVVDGYILVNDPIVLQPVKGGYLIVTAWGDEASDPAVVNEINN